MNKHLATKLARLMGVGMIGVGAVGLSLGVASPASAATVNVPLHNETAPEGDCPTQAGQYWHFIVAPNNGTYTFVTITLNIDGLGSVVFTSAQWIENGGQHDSVYVPVPAGKALTDLLLSGSTADISPDSGGPKFVLSHLCDGTPPDTTSSDVTTSSDATTSSDVTSSSDATTSSDVTSSSSGESTTTEESTTTVSEALVAGPVPTSTNPTTSLVIDAAVNLPETGRNSEPVAWLALLVTGLGAAAIGFSRRPARR